MDLIIVESPNKIKSIKKYVGNGYIVKASVGHFREMPRKELGVNEETLEEKYIIPEDKKNVIKDILDTINRANIQTVYLASDDDREGEAIAWHLKTEIDKKANVKYKRLRVREITEEGLKTALSNPGEINIPMVEAQRTRRVIDRLTGYKISPVLWQKFNRKGLSAGRVQSAILSILADRERDIAKFKPEDYYKVSIIVEETPSFKAELKSITKENKEIQVKQLKDEEAEKILTFLKKLQYTVTGIEDKESKRNPSAPFTTATLQQEASQQLGFTSNLTMKIAQKLFEQGLITYHRTDSVFLSNSAIQMVRQHIESEYGNEFLPVKANQFKSGENAQEAHEAIRPTSFEHVSIKDEEAKLLDLIKKRTIASQMNSAKYKILEYKIQAGPFNFEVKGKKLIEQGYLKAYNDVDEEKEEDIALPILEQEQILKNVIPEKTKHKTKAPSRFTEKNLLKHLDKLGVGRPSTWATMIEKLLAKQYTILEKKQFSVSELGLFLDENLQKYFNEFLQVKATADMENDLDLIATGKEDRYKVLNKFKNELYKELEQASRKITNTDLSENTKKFKCKCCGEELRVTNKVAKCNSCGFISFKNVYSKELTENQWTQLLEEGQTIIIKGFKSKDKSKPSFSAALKIDETTKKVIPVFEERKKCGYCNEGVIYENEKTFNCSKCGFFIYKSIGGKKIPKNEINNLIMGNTTGTLKMKGAKGEFEAKIRWNKEDQKLQFVR